MNKKRNCLVGYDDDFSWIIPIVIAMIVFSVVCAVIVYGGAFIGGYHSIKNYISAFKHNVIESNREPIPAP